MFTPGWVPYTHFFQWRMTGEDLRLVKTGIGEFTTGSIRDFTGETGELRWEPMREDDAGYTRGIPRIPLGGSSNSQFTSANSDF